MINIETVREELDLLLNGKKSSNSFSPFTEEYSFLVASAGFELKHTYDMKTGKNFFPVLIDCAGGEFNPVPNLGEYDITYQLTIWFPVRKKNHFYTTVIEWLREQFVGKTHAWGGEVALSNISAPQFGEVETYSTEKFIKTQFKVPFSVSEQWMAMTFDLYLTSYKDLGDRDRGGFILSNDVKATFSYEYEGETYTEEEPVFVETAINANSSPVAEQILGENETKGYAGNTAYGSGLSIYVKSSDFYRNLLKVFTDGDIQNFLIKYKLYDDSGAQLFVYERDCYMTESSLSIVKGSLITLSFNVATRK